MIIIFKKYQIMFLSKTWVLQAVTNIPLYAENCNEYERRLIKMIKLKWTKNVCY